MHQKQREHRKGQAQVYSDPSIALPTKENEEKKGGDDDGQISDGEDPIDVGMRVYVGKVIDGVMKVFHGRMHPAPKMK